MAEMTIEIHDSIRLDLIEDLKSCILELARHQASVGGNNVGGWKSDDAILERKLAPLDALAETLRKDLFAREIGVLAAWAMINCNGSYHKRHRHGDRYKVGVYYVSAGNPAVPTIFDIEELRPGTRQGSGLVLRRQSVDPVPGRLVVIPGNMWHEVRRYDGEEPRITIPFELR